MYLSGRGVAKDLKKAAQLFEKAANQGNSKAQYNLGLMYLKGSSGVPENREEKAIQLFVRAARQGDPAAQYRLGLMYMSTTMNYFLEAAKQGHDKAQKQLNFFKSAKENCNQNSFKKPSIKI